MPNHVDPPTSLGIVRGVSYGLFGTPDDWLASARELGARLFRVYLYWSQIEPQPGEWDWTVPDALRLRHPGLSTRQSAAGLL